MILIKLSVYLFLPRLLTINDKHFLKSAFTAKLVPIPYSPRYNLRLHHYTFLKLLLAQITYMYMCSKMPKVRITYDKHESRLGITVQALMEQLPKFPGKLVVFFTSFECVYYSTKQLGLSFH